MVQTVRGVFTVFCGMTFPIIILPVWAKAVALSLPPTYLIGDLRAVLLKGSDFVSLVPELAILAADGPGAVRLRGRCLPAHRALRPTGRQPGAVLSATGPMSEELRAAWAVARKELQVARRYPLKLVNEVLQPLYQFLLPSLLLGLTFYVGGARCRPGGHHRHR